MLQRGRKSAASNLRVFTGKQTRRPDPPEDLTDDQKAVWQSVVSRLPVDWFPGETHSLLAQYCRHVTRAGEIAKVLDRLLNSKKFDPSAYNKLLTQELAQTRAIAALSTRMRMSQQSTLDKSKKKTFNAGQAEMTEDPWGDDESADGTNPD